MAQKVVATISSGTKGFVKVIASVKSKRNDKAVSFKTQMLTLEKADEFVKNLKK